MSTSDELQASLSKLIHERELLWDKDDELNSTLRSLHPLSEEYAVVRTLLDENFNRSRTLSKEIDQLRDLQKQQMRIEGKQIDVMHALEAKHYRRPSGPLGTFFSKGLGPLPNYSWRIDPTPKALARAKSYWPLALGMVIVAIALLVTLTLLIPWMNLSPASLIFFLAESAFGKRWGTAVGVVGTIALGFFASQLVRHENHYEGKHVDKFAMFEEQWFRMGAENWTTSQRIRSCIAFSLVHVTNIIYPIASLLVVGLVGVGFMAVYLHTFKKTGSTKHATIASAKLHATYNRFAIGYIIVALGIGLLTNAYLMFD